MDRGPLSGARLWCEGLRNVLPEKPAAWAPLQRETRGNPATGTPRGRAAQTDGTSRSRLFVLTGLGARERGESAWPEEPSARNRHEAGRRGPSDGGSRLRIGQGVRAGA